jgi:hypothetical protein
LQRKDGGIGHPLPGPRAADPAIAKLGTRLDRQLADLLDALGVKASRVLGAAEPAGAKRL